MGLTGQALADYARGKKGTPYFYGSKMAILTENFMDQMHKSYPNTVTEAYIAKARDKGQVGKECTDCSGLVSAYTKKVLGSAQLYQQAYTRLAVSTYKSWANGVVVWRSGHVGVFFKENGNYYVAEAKGIDYGTVISAFSPDKWRAGLTFSWMDYSYTENVVSQATWRGTNPYKQPTETILKGSIGEGVRWVQWELVEAGYDIAIDGDCGKKTDAAIRAFQASCKIKVDGKVGPETRKYLLADVGSESAVPTPTPTPAPIPTPAPAPTPTPVPAAPEEIYGIVTGTGVRIRKGPGTNYDVVGHVDKGQRVRIWTESRGWYMIDNDKWVYAQYVRVN